MKRPARLILTLCLLALLVGGGFALRHRSPAQPTLQLDPTTQAILAHADRVEVFRLADFHEDQFRTGADMETRGKSRLGNLDDYTILRVAPPQDSAFAHRLLSALSAAKDPSHSFEASCFDPGVGFRVWRGHAHTDAVVCFYCSGVDIITTNADGQQTWHTHTELGQARASLLALSRAAFPDDPILNDLKSKA